MSHRDCDHAATKRDRAQCRASRVKSNTFEVVTLAFIFVTKARAEGYSNTLSVLTLEETAQEHGYVPSQWSMSQAKKLVRERADVRDQRHLITDEF